MSETPAPFAGEGGGGFPPPAEAWRSTVILASIGFFLSMDVQLTALLLEPMKRGLGLSDVRIALLQGTAFGLTFGITSIPLGGLIDRTNRVRLLLGSVALWILAMIGTGLSSSFGLLVACRIVLGAVAALLLPAAISLISDMHPAQRRSFTTSLFAVGQAVGQAFGVYAGGHAFDALTKFGPVAGQAPWRVLYVAAGGLGLLLLPLLRVVREPARQEVDASVRTLGQAVRDLWAHRLFLAPLLLAAMFSQVATQSSAVWAMPLLIRVHHLTPGQFADWYSAVVLVCSILGALSAGQLGEIGRRRAGRAGVLIPALVAVLLLAPLSAFGLAPTVPTFAVSLGLNLFLSGIVVTIIVVAIAMNIPNEIRGLAVGANIFVSAVVGTACGPLLIASASSALGGEAHLASAIALVSAPCLLVSAACFGWALRNGRRTAA